MSRRTGLYVHWPFCARICPYCDFTVTRSRDEDMTEWAAAFRADLTLMAEWFGPRPLSSVYFGGGTPSLMPPSLVEEIIAMADDIFGILPAAEITLEANPAEASEVLFADLSQAGIRRLSLGLQSFDDDQLTFLGRDHDGATARHALDLALDTMPKVTADFIYALPDEGEAAWRARLSDLIATGVKHLSLYQLTIEPGTAFHRAVARNAWQPSDEDVAADLFALTQEVTSAAGLPAYEISNHAAPGHEAVHNSLYWRADEWLGIGPGAHGRLSGMAEDPDARWAVAASTNIRRYLDLSPQDRFTAEQLDDVAQAIELVAGGLRTRRGLDLGALPSGVRSDVEAAMQKAKADGLIRADDGRVVVAEEARLLTDYIAGRLVERL